MGRLFLKIILPNGHCSHNPAERRETNLFAASVKGNPGKTNKLGSFKYTNDCTRAQSYLYIITCLLRYFLPFYL